MKYPVLFPSLHRIFTWNSFWGAQWLYICAFNKSKQKKANFPHWLNSYFQLSIYNKQYLLIIYMCITASAASALNSCLNFQMLNDFILTVQTNLIFHYAAFLSFFLSCSSCYTENCILKIEVWAFGYCKSNGFMGYIQFSP